MSTQHISGQDFNVMIGDILVHVESMNATITDNRAPVQVFPTPVGINDLNH